MTADRFYGWVFLILSIFSIGLAQYINHKKSEDIAEIQTKAVELQCGERLSDGSFKWKEKQ